MVSAAKYDSARARSMATCMSAALCWTAWNDPIGTPNCWRAADVLEHQVEHPLARADHRQRHPGQCDVAGPRPHRRRRRGRCVTDRARRRRSPRRRAAPDRTPTRGETKPVRPPTTNTPAGVDHRESVGAVTVQHVTRGAVEHPAVTGPRRGHAVVDGRAGQLRVGATRRQRGELGQGRQERRRVGGPAEFLDEDVRARPSRTDRSARSSPCRYSCATAAPDRRYAGLILGDTAHQRRRALLGQHVPHGVTPQPLIGIQLQQHPSPR